MKSEPDVFSIDDLKSKGRAPWDGVRNFQARNFMRDQMKMGDLILFYHSSTEPPGVAGVARVCREAYPDPTAWDPKGPYYDPKSTAEKPQWMMVDVEYITTFPRYIPLESLRTSPKLKKMLVIRRGMRLSVQPVSEQEFKTVCAMGNVERRLLSL